MTDYTPEKCCYCGRFIAWKELGDENKTGGHFVPDSDISKEEISFWHKYCNERIEDEKNTNEKRVNGCI